LDSPSARLDLSQYAVPPTQLLSARRGLPPLDLKELRQSHELLWSLAVRDVRARYKQTVLGAAWVVLQPLIAAGIFTFIFTIVADLQAPSGVPYFLFTFTGLLAWNSFSSVLTRSSGSLVANAGLVSKVYFPRLVLPLATVLTVLLDLAVASVLLVLLVLWHWQLPGWTILLLPVCIGLLWGLALGVGLCVAAVAVSYRDALYVLPVVTQFLMWGSAVLFPTGQVPERFQWILYLNPLVSLIEGFRWSVLGVGTMHWGSLGYSAAFTLVVLLMGLFAFRQMERRFADVI
jgi:lipopolysaccharide transport system permease protein